MSLRDDVKCIVCRGKYDISRRGYLFIERVGGKRVGRIRTGLAAALNALTLEGSAIILIIYTIKLKFEGVGA